MMAPDKERPATLTALMRTVLAFLLAVVGLALLPVADLGLWVEREVVTTTAFVRLADDVLNQPAVRVALTQRIAREIEGNVPALAGQDATVRPTVARVISSPRFRPALDDALTNTYNQLRAGDSPLQLDPNLLVPSIREQLPADLAARVPANLNLPPVVALRRQDAPAVWSAVQLVQNSVPAIPIVTVVVLALAIVVSRRRGALCTIIGAGTVLVSIGLIALVEPGRSLLEQHAGADPVPKLAFLAGYDTVMRTFVAQTVALAIAGVVLALLGIVVSWHRPRTVRRPALA